MPKRRALLLLAAGATSVVAGVGLWLGLAAALIVGGAGVGAYAWNLEVKQ